MGNLSPHLGNKDFFALETSVFSLRGLCGNSSAVKYGQAFIKRILPLTFTKKLLLLLLILYMVPRYLWVRNSHPHPHPCQCDVLLLGIAVITIMKVAVINQHHSHYLY